MQFNLFLCFLLLFLFFYLILYIVLGEGCSFFENFIISLEEDFINYQHILKIFAFTILPFTLPTSKKLANVLKKG